MKSKELTTLFVGRQLTRLQSTASTNSYLAEQALTSNLPEGVVIVSEFQTAGRGQESIGWESEPGKNLLLSVLLKPAALDVKRIFLLSKAVSLALKDLLTEYGIESKIKWPNDIYVGEKKICGTLIENTLRGEQLQQSIVGIGLNINQEVFPDNIPNPISMKQILGKEFFIDECLFSLCNHLERRYFELKSRSYDKLNSEYLYSLYKFNQRINFRMLNGSDEIFKAEIFDVEDEGWLVLKRADGSFSKFGFKEIEFIKTHPRLEE